MQKFNDDKIGLKPIIEDTPFTRDYPKLVEEWDFEKNEEIADINKVTHGSTLKVWWICKDGHSYIARIGNRASKVGSSKPPTGCKQCHDNSLRKYDKEAEDKVRDAYVKPLTNATDIGDATEEYIVALLEESYEYLSVERTGQFGGKADIKITTFEEEVFYIQVKTLYQSTSNAYSYYENGMSYDDNMLMVLVHPKSEHYILDFYENIKGILQFNFTDNESYMYIDKDEFLENLIEMIPSSCVVEEYSPCTKKELLSLRRFKEYCEKNHVVYKDRKDNTKPIDGYMNDVTFQHKFAEYPKGKSITYRATCVKYAGKYKGHKLHNSYEIGDFDFLVVELGGTVKEPNKYKNQFCIIPESVLVAQGILRTPTNKKGKKEVYFAPPDYKRDHWTKKYWHNLDISL